jgi:hypothetical protein
MGSQRLRTSLGKSLQAPREPGASRFAPRRFEGMGASASRPGFDFTKVPVHSPEKNRTGLPDRLKDGIEALSGLSLDGVRVRYGSREPARFDALAYARGREIHLAPGQERHLPHEAWHAVQQMQGRVRASSWTMGEGLNADPGLETEADAMGERATRVTAACGAEPPLPPLPVASPVVQRKVGFEFESTGDQKWRFQGRDDDDEKWAGIANTKDILLPTPSDKAGAGADKGNVEFITKPLADWETVAKTMAELETMTATIRENTPYALTAAQNTKAGEKTELAQHRIVAPADLVAKPQATIGVGAASIEGLFTALIRMNQGQGPTEDTQALEFDTTIASNTLVYRMNTSLDEAKGFIATACTAAGFNFATLSENAQKEIVGFVTIILKTLWDAYSNSGATLTDPKYAFPLMPRTDFRSMLATLDAGARDLFVNLWQGGQLPTAINATYPLNGVIFPGGYTGTDARRHRGPTKRQWIDSIVGGQDPKDLLSPPPAFPRHSQTPRPEGLGAYSSDEELILFELRDLTGAGPLPPEKWVELALAVCRLVAKVEGVAALDPPLADEKAED